MADNPKAAAPFGSVPGEREARVWTLENAVLRVRITDFGGRMVSIEAPDRDGRRDHVLLGFDDAAAYAQAGGSFGALLGRTANRIAGGRFVIDGRPYEVSRNEGDNTLHGGKRGFGLVFWDVADTDARSLVLTHISAEGDQGFPGAVSVEARYRLEDGCLSLTFTATTTAPTPLSLSAHPYFNLAGPDAGDILGHTFEIPADAFLPTDAAQLPTGELRPVAGTPFDFRQPATAAARIRQPDDQLRAGKGYDHYFVLDPDDRGELRRAARAHDPESGRTLEVWTSQPGTQFYTGNNLNGSVIGRGGAYRQSAGFAFEPQGFPDAVNQPGFPTTVLRPQETYRQVIEYRFAAAR